MASIGSEITSIHSNKKIIDHFKSLMIILPHLRVGPKRLFNQKLWTNFWLNKRCGPTRNCGVINIKIHPGD